jgi:hypothetical protein
MVQAPDRLALKLVCRGLVVCHAATVSYNSKLIITLTLGFLGFSYYKTYNGTLKKNLEINTLAYSCSSVSDEKVL